MESLKPCPFCGATEGNLYITSLEGRSDETVAIFCNSCKTLVFIEDNDNEGDNIFTRQKAVQAWNRRVDHE